MSVEITAPGRQFPTIHVESVLVRNEVVFEPREISQGKNDITVKYHTWLDPRTSLDDLSAQLMTEGGGVESRILGSGQAGEGVARRLPRVGGLRVADDEEDLALAHEAQLLAGERLDRPGVFLQAPDVITEPDVLLALLGQRGRQGAVLPARAQRVEQALVSHQGVHDQHHGHERQHVVEDHACARARLQPRGACAA